MRQTISPASAVRGEVSLPGDKSISHRYAMIAAVAEGQTRIHNYSTGADCHSTLGCVRALGVAVAGAGTEFTIGGRGLDGLRAAAGDLDAGNSGSTIRMLSGILAAQPFGARIFGDESLSRRPMQRVIQPLEAMGARIRARDGRFPPLEIHGAALRPIDYVLPVASAQVKTCVLFAGLFAAGRTSVTEPARSRDHTEIALREFGAEVAAQGRKITVEGRPRLEARELFVPSDLSSAAFFLAAALLVPGSQVVIRGVGLNPTRSALLDFLTGMGAGIRIPDLETRNGELVGDIAVEYSALRGGTISGGLTAALIDEIPVLAAAAPYTENGLEVRDGKELRVKESDRIAAVATNLRKMGAEVEERPDGLRIPGRQNLHGAEIDSFGDHRIAMAFAIAALRAEGDTLIYGSDAAGVSYPTFFDDLRSLTDG